MNLNRNRDYLYNGMMFFLPLSTFLISRVTILGTKLKIAYKKSLSAQNIGIKIYYEDRYTGKICLAQKILKKEFQLSFPPSDFNLVAYENQNIIDRIIFHFDPMRNLETGRVRFVFARDYIQKIVDDGENVEVEFKGYKDLNFDKDELIKTVVSFANTLGGIILIGVEDNKNIFGFKHIISTEDFRKWITTIIKAWCDPLMDFAVDEMIMGNGQRIFIIHISIGTNRPYFKILGNKTGIYVRVNDSDFMCDRTLFDDFMKRIRYNSNSPISDINEYDVG
jgi:hypothetical protein